MKKKNGFISMSLVYSFLVLFDKAGVVKSIAVSKGTAVENGQVLVVIG